MNATEINVQQAVKRVEAFAATHAGAFAPTSNAAVGFARVTPLLTEIGPVGQPIGAPASSATEAKAAIFDELREDLKDIAKTARRINKTDPGIATSFKTGKRTQRSIVKTAATYLENLKEPATVAKFIAFDLPPDFVTNLEDDLKAIDDLGGVQDTDAQEATGETARIRVLIAEARELLKNLDTSVTNRFRRDPEIMAQWNTAARIHRAPRPARPVPAEGESTKP